MRLLVDSHVVMWWSGKNRRLPQRWAEVMEGSENEVFLSAASVWETEIKRRSGKLHLPVSLTEVAEAERMTVLDITAADALLAGSLDWDHKDPFDRMLVAQARERGLTIVTADESMLTAPGVRFLP